MKTLYERYAAGEISRDQYKDGRQAEYDAAYAALDLVALPCNHDWVNAQRARSGVIWCKACNPTAVISIEQKQKVFLIKVAEE